MRFGHAVAASSTAVVLLAACSTSEVPEPSPVTAPDPVSIWNSVGVATNVASVDMPGTTAERDLQSAAQAGFDGVRLVVEWSEIEAERGELDWSAMDSEVDAALSAGLPILGVVTWSPTWAVPPEYALTAHPAPADPELFAAFAGAAADRYRDRITAWEVWNEPNVAATFGPSAHPERYCSLLSATSRAIRAAAPDAVIVTGSTSPAVDSVNSLAPATFVEALYRCAGGSTFDAVSMHPYSTPALLSEPAAEWDSANEIARVRDVMIRYGDTAKQIWFTEFGAPTVPTYPGVDEMRQAEILVDGIETLHQLDYAGPVFVFDLRDSATADPSPEYNYGLLRSDYTPKPAFGAVRNLLR
ncbi:cellulase family glycosylhydrolase [Rhodococcus sp. 14-2470-1a]|uniref:cellulase family glycosylhydrolase n=1 Tax=Rhodococcus sp. 14-2470-1a TaxID=2023150 RepID=UPI00211B5B6E|nr:cellulase family glycosylhydrolase [Rhodococcus sp. 14-2470-1a]